MIKRYIFFIMGCCGMIAGFNSCVKPPPIEKPPQDIKIYHAVGTFEQIAYEPENAIDGPKTVNIKIRLDTSEIPAFNARLQSDFRISSLKRSLYLDAQYNNRDDKNLLHFQWTNRYQKGVQADKVELDRIKRCLRNWSVGEKCLLEYTARKGTVPKPGTVR